MKVKRVKHQRTKKKKTYRKITTKKETRARKIGDIVTMMMMEKGEEQQQQEKEESNTHIHTYLTILASMSEFIGFERLNKSRAVCYENFMHDSHRMLYRQARNGAMERSEFMIRGSSDSFAKPNKEKKKEKKNEIN